LIASSGLRQIDGCKKKRPAAKRGLRYKNRGLSSIDCRSLMRFSGYAHGMAPAANPAKRLDAILSAFLMLVVPLLAGCPSAPLHYTLVRSGEGSLVAPPRTSAAAAAAPTFETKIRKSRTHPPRKVDCDIEDGPVTIHWQGDSAVAQIKSGGLAQSEPNGALYFDSFKEVPLFEHALVQIESKGCLRSDEDYRLKQLLTQRLPLPSPLAYELRFGSYDLTGYLDLTSDFQMQVVSPLYATNRAGLRFDDGRETGYYSLIPSKSNDHIRIHLTFTIDVFAGKSKPPSQNHIQFPKSFGYSRLFLRSEKSAGSSVTRAILVSAPDRIKLAAATTQIQESAGDSCRAVTDPKVDCIIFPADFGVNAALRVTVNGTEKYVYVGATLGAVLETNSIPKTLRVERFFRGRLIPISFDQGTPDIGSLVLMPGDQISW
jgi:hypothetical protein